MDLHQWKLRSLRGIFWRLTAGAGAGGSSDSGGDDDGVNHPSKPFPLPNPNPNPNRGDFCPVETKQSCNSLLLLIPETSTGTTILGTLPYTHYAFIWSH